MIFSSPAILNFTGLSVPVNSILNAQKDRKLSFPYADDATRVVLTLNNHVANLKEKFDNWILNNDIFVGDWGSHEIGGNIIAYFSDENDAIMLTLLASDCVEALNNNAVAFS